MKKLWYTTSEIAKLRIPGLPATQRGVYQKLNKEGILEHPTKSRRRANSGGGREYHVSLLPREAQNILALRSLKKDSSILEEPPEMVVDPLETPAGKSGLRRDAKMTVLMIWNSFLKDSMESVEVSQYAFTQLYKSRKIPAMPEWVYAEVKSFSVSSLRNWIKARDNGEENRLAGQYGNRKGTGLLDTAFDGEVAKYIVAMIINHPHLNGDHIHDLVREKFGDPWPIEVKGQTIDKPVPTIRTIQRWVKSWKQENAETLMKITNPDGWKNKYMIAPGKANAWVTAPNQIWEIDASPADAMCSDGRYNIYCVIDIYTRRMKILVSRTPTTQASLLLIRQAIMDWGVPEIIKTDNGSDFVSQAFVRALTNLQIKRDVAAPFTPEHKGTVERAIGTFQRSFMAPLGSFVGHNVMDRKKIEGRKSFAQRLGTKDKRLFEVDLTAVELQDMANQWVENKYHHRGHQGINGATPHEMAATWTGHVRRIENEQALHIMLAEVPGKSGHRTVTKKGISVDGITYWNDLMMVGQRLHIRHDPADLGRLYCFNEDGDAFVFEAINTDYLGIDRRAIAEAAKAHQRERLKEETAEITRETRKYKDRHAADALLRQAGEDARKSTVVAFPNRDENYSTPAIDAATEALVAKTLDLPTGPANAAEHYEQALIDQEKVAARRAMISPVDAANERYMRAKTLMAQTESGFELEDADRKWLNGYLDSAEFRTRSKMEESFGENFFQK